MSGRTPRAPADLVTRGRRVLGGVVLGSEALVLLFATLVAKDLSRYSPGTALAVGLGLAALALVLAGVAARPVGLVGGSVLQVAVLASGLVVPAMLVLGVVFAAFWMLALVLPLRADRLRTDQAARRGEHGG